MIVGNAKAQNPRIKLFATLAYSNEILQALQTIISNQAILQAFATNIATCLNEYNLDGFDIDWEWPISNLTSAECAAWLNALRQAFGNDLFISISPAVASGLDATAVNNNCDIINLQIYSGFTSPDAFTEIGINPALLGFGAKFESVSVGGPPYQNAYSASQQYQAGFTVNNTAYAYKTVCTWRLDSDNWDFEQGQQLLLSQYIKGAPATVTFDDGVILNAQTTPTLMKSITIWTGDVVDAIQTSNQSTDGTYELKMLQHGGDTGNANPAIDLPEGLTAFSYVSGYWYGNYVIAQVTVAGNSYPAAISGAVTGAQTTTVAVPAGRTIVGFSGASQYVMLASGGYTWVLASIDAVFA